jgi:hypothetical protein
MWASGFFQRRASSAAQPVPPRTVLSAWMMPTTSYLARAVDLVPDGLEDRHWRGSRWAPVRGRLDT